MSKSYSVEIDGDVENPGNNAISLTGKVNGVPVAVIARLSLVRTATDPSREKKLALIAAYESRINAPTATAKAELITI